MKYSIKECCVLFEIEDIDDITLCEIKRKYHKLCLKHHPDKSQLHSSDTSEFLKIKDMYEQLIHFKETMCQSSETHKKTDELDIYHYFLLRLIIVNQQGLIIGHQVSLVRSVWYEYQNIIDINWCYI